MTQCYINHCETSCPGGGTEHSHLNLSIYKSLAWVLLVPLRGSRARPELQWTATTAFNKTETITLTNLVTLWQPGDILPWCVKNRFLCIGEFSAQGPVKEDGGRQRCGGSQGDQHIQGSLGAGAGVVLAQPQQGGGGGRGAALPVIV